MQSFTFRLEQQPPQLKDVVRVSQPSLNAQLEGYEEIQDEQGLGGL